MWLRNLKLEKKKYPDTFVIKEFVGIFDTEYFSDLMVVIYFKIYKAMVEGKTTF